MIKYNVSTFRAAGLEARWTKTFNGSPIISARYPQGKLAHQREKWWLVSGDMWETMLQVGIVAGFEQWTLLGDLFSIGGGR